MRRSALVLALSLSCSTSAHAYDEGPLSRALGPFLAIDDPFTLCGEQRLFTWNESFVHHDVVDELRARAEETGRSPLAVLAGLGEDLALDDVARERCRFNRFRFLVQVTYFDLYDDVARAGSVVDDAFIAEVWRAKADAFRAWAESARARDVVAHPSDTHEWEGTDVSRDSIDEFLARESQIKPWLSHLARTLVSAPSYDDDDDDDEATAALHAALRMRTPFSAIWPRLAFTLAQRAPVQRALACLATATRAMSCDENLYDAAAACTARARFDDESAPLVLLGLFASQEAFLVRDLRVFIDTHLARDDARRALDALLDGAAVYYDVHALGAACGAGPLYPRIDRRRRESERSRKAYHYYAMALAAAQLVRLGFDDDVARRAPAALGRRYKRYAVIMGAAYSVVTGVPITRGGTADFDEVTTAQRDGARFGVAVARAARTTPIARARASVVDVVAPRVARFRWVDARTVRVHVASAIPLAGGRDVDVVLAEEHARAFADGALAYPRVQLVGAEIVVSF